MIKLCNRIRVCVSVVKLERTEALCRSRIFINIFARSERLWYTVCRASRHTNLGRKTVGTAGVPRPTLTP